MTAMNEAPAVAELSCDVCGAVLPTDSPDSYLRLENDTRTFGNVCSWVCSLQFCVLKAAEAEE
jgi:hypothetical protein